MKRHKPQLSGIDAHRLFQRTLHSIILIGLLFTNISKASSQPQLRKWLTQHDVVNLQTSPTTATIRPDATGGYWPANALYDHTPQRNLVFYVGNREIMDPSGAPVGVMGIPNTWYGCGEAAIVPALINDACTEIYYVLTPCRDVDEQEIALYVTIVSVKPTLTVIGGFSIIRRPGVRSSVAVTKAKNGTRKLSTCNDFYFCTLKIFFIYKLSSLF